MFNLAFIALAYLLGSLSPAYWLVRLKKGADLRHLGTGTLGGSNVGEQLGRPWMFVSGAADVLKGLVPVAAANWLGLGPDTAALAGLGVVIGHNWPVWLGFKGGRGLGPALGMLLALDWRLCLVLLLSMALSPVLKLTGPGPLVGVTLLAPVAAILQDDRSRIAAGLALLLVVVVKRLEANRLPLPRTWGERRAVLWRRFWHDRDVPLDQPWQERKRID